ncbi:hypothetical protein VZ169_19250, partial [Acinetobacter baumannii]|nr:hypothetical protein [Acinetobacter baumannii]
DLNQLTESLDKEHMYYQNMRQAMLMRAKALNCTFDKQRGTWISPPEFNGISDQQRDELQNFIAERGLDVKTVCEHLLQSPSAVILEPKKIKSDTVSTVSPSISHEVMGLNAIILVF